MLIVLGGSTPMWLTDLKHITTNFDWRPALDFILNHWMNMATYGRI
jgi:hypothetical protein